MESVHFDRGRGLPVVTKNLLIINVIIFIISSLPPYNAYVFKYFALYYPFSDNFYPFQLFTSIFLHGGLTHLLLNMYTMVMFGVILERVWGPKRFLTFYLLTGVGASLFLCLINTAEVYYYTKNIFLNENTPLAITDQSVIKILRSCLGPTIGASGAICGLLSGFAVLFPNTMIMSLIPPIPMKAKYFIPFFMILSITMGVANFSWDNIAHFAHLGGAIIGYIIIKFWNKNQPTFY
jgi:membrane associated rhomboid family serine protease